MNIFIYRKHSDVNPHFTLPVKSIQSSVTVWAAIVDDQLIGPYFFDRTVNGKLYLEMLMNFLVPEMNRRGIDPKTIVFQQDGAPPHNPQPIRRFLNRTFRSWIGRFGRTKWPARSPDLTVMDFFLWSRLKDIVYQEISRDDNELKDRIRDAFRQITPEMLRNTQGNFDRRLAMCIAQNGRHFEQVMKHGPNAH